MSSRDKSKKTVMEQKKQGLRIAITHIERIRENEK
jgi:hypothetical protein